MKVITQEVAKKVIGGVCTDNYEMNTLEKCIRTTTCTNPVTKFGSNKPTITQTEVASTFCATLDQ